MDTQQERSRMDEDNINAPETDVTRSERQQSTHNAAEGRNASNNPMRGDNDHHGQEETGSHQEGMYDKQSSKPMVDKDGAGQIDK